MIYQVAKLHKLTQKGFSARFPVFIIAAFYLYQVFITNILLVERRGDKLAGFMLLEKSKPEITFISISPEFQGQGIGSRLIERVKLRPLYVRFSDSAKGFYEKLGFKVVVDIAVGEYYGVLI